VPLNVPVLRVTAAGPRDEPAVAGWAATKSAAKKERIVPATAVRRIGLPSARVHHRLWSRAERRSIRDKVDKGGTQEEIEPVRTSLGG